MNHISDAIDQLHAVDFEARSDGWLQRLHPLTKLVVTIAFLVVLVSFPKYQMAGVLLMAVYPIVLCILGGVSVSLMWRRTWAVLLLVCFVGLFNPFFDHTPLIKIGGFTITGGMISFLTLLLKGCLAVMAAYLLMLTTTMEDLCQALRKIHVPAVLVTVLMLIFRYLMLFLHEVERITQAYSLRAPALWRNFNIFIVMINICYAYIRHDLRAITYFQISSSCYMNILLNANIIRNGNFRGKLLL